MVNISKGRCRIYQKCQKANEYGIFLLIFGYKMGSFEMREIDFRANVFKPLSNKGCALEARVLKYSLNASWTTEIILFIFTFIWSYILFYISQQRNDWKIAIYENYKLFKEVGVTTGAPQGSRLGPLLFSLCTKKIKRVFKSWKFLMLSDNF